MHYVLTSAVTNPGVPNKANTCGRIISKWLFSVLCWCQWALTGCASNATDRNLLRHPLVCWQPFLQKLFAEPRTVFPKKQDTGKKEKNHTYSVGRQQSTPGLQITLEQSSKLLKKNPKKTAQTKEHCSRHFFKYSLMHTHTYVNVILLDVKGNFHSPTQKSYGGGQDQYLDFSRTAVKTEPLLSFPSPQRGHICSYLPTTAVESILEQFS